MRLKWMREVKKVFDEKTLPTKTVPLPELKVRNVHSEVADAGKGVVKIPALEPLEE